jgi:hypothetical protein
MYFTFILRKVMDKLHKKIVKDLHYIANVLDACQLFEESTKVDSILKKVSSKMERQLEEEISSLEKNS